MNELVGKKIKLLGVWHDDEMILGPELVYREIIKINNQGIPCVKDIFKGSVPIDWSGEAKFTIEEDKLYQLRGNAVAIFDIKEVKE